MTRTTSLRSCRRLGLPPIEDTPNSNLFHPCPCRPPPPPFVVCRLDATLRQRTLLHVLHMDRLNQTLFLEGPDGQRIPVMIEGYDARTGQGIIRPVQSLPPSTPAREGKGGPGAGGSGSGNRPAPSAPILFPTSPAGDKAITAAGPGFTASVMLHPPSTTHVSATGFHNACVSETWTALRAPRASDVYELDSLKALPPAGYEDEPMIAEHLEAHYASSVAAASAAAAAHKAALDAAAQERRELTATATAHFKAQASSKQAASSSSTASSSTGGKGKPVQALRRPQRGARKRGRAGDGDETVGGTPGATPPSTPGESPSSPSEGGGAAATLAAAVGDLSGPQPPPA